MLRSVYDRALPSGSTYAGVWRKRLRSIRFAGSNDSYKGGISRLQVYTSCLAWDALSINCKVQLCMCIVVSWL